MAGSEIDAALAAGATVVTPNNRLARRIVADYDAAKVRAGCRAWDAARALPWHAWVATLWQDAGASMASVPRLLPPSAAHHLWVRVIEDPLRKSSPLLEPHDVADLAQDAWTLMHAWGAGGESWRAWRDRHDAPTDSDPAQFAAWAERYRRELERVDATDSALLADVLAGHEFNGCRDRTVALAGFLEVTPQQRRLLARLTAAGSVIRECAVATTHGTLLRAAPATPRDELRAALDWARRRVEAGPDQRVGIVVDDLAARLDEVRAHADDALCPSLQWPGNAGQRRPYDVSLGRPLAQSPMIAAALSVVALAHEPLARGDAAALLRSPFLPGAWAARAHCEREWLRESRADIGWDDAYAWLAGVDPPLAARWRAARPRAWPSGPRSPRAWCDAWRDVLAAVGWPGPRPLSSAEYEASAAWDELLVDFARIGIVDTTMTAGAALQSLRRLAAKTIFQPDSAGASVTILGTLEAASLPFDALWVTGMTGDRWPPAPRPHPLLPLRWQRERAVPHASAARELAYARTLVDTLAGGAPTVVLSHPQNVDDYPAAPSALIPARAAPLEMPALPPTTARRIERLKSLQSIGDERAPPLAAGAVGGGAALIERQSDCPFRAAATFRLAAEPWPRAAEGLGYQERGTLVHAALAAFWRATGSHAALAALDRAALHARVADAVVVARRAIPPARWRLLPAAVAAAEADRIAQLVAQWIEDVDRARPPFRVTGVEVDATLDLAGLRLRLRVDRIDSVDGGGRVIVDYKTGDTVAPAHWFRPRPRAPQLGLYALAQDDPTAVRAVAYASVKAGSVKATGLAADDGVWPSLQLADRLDAVGGWTGAFAWWRTHLPAVAQEYRDGVATVTPRDNGTPCRTCGLQPLCRIGEFDADEAPDGDNE
ncbi:MAG: PD-(D/E)XK nuclease family protein [Burkholderiales bacterium]